MKILDKYILKTFLTTFLSVFVILFFIFVLQVVWLFIYELAGKDLDLSSILKFLLFKMPSVVPLVLPLSVLLSSIMTFGDLSENYEFAAMKSAGISLKRAIQSLVIFISLLSVGAFFFGNNIIPIAEYKFTNFRRDIAQVKPAMIVAEGQFSEIGSYNIKVDKKYGENGKYLKGITIHKKSKFGEGNTTVIKAKDGQLLSSKESNNLQLILFNGTQYEDIIPKDYNERNQQPFSKSEFKKYVVNMDLSQLNGSDANNQQDISTFKMLTLNELRFTIDSLNKNFKTEVVSFTENINQGSYNNSGVVQNLKSNSSGTPQKTIKIVNYFEKVGNIEKSLILSTAKNNISGSIFTIKTTKDDMFYKQKMINGHWIEVYDKFVMAFACLLMFFIGAPLGAIIRKGGLGLPIVFAILIFITFHFTNTFGRKLAQENGITPFFGSWMSSMILTPLAILLTYRASNDIGLINFDKIMMPLQLLFARITKKKQD